MKFFRCIKVIVASLIGSIPAVNAQTMVPVSPEFPPPTGLTFAGQWECKNGTLTARLQIGKNRGGHPKPASLGRSSWTTITESQEDMVGHFLVGFDRGTNEFLLFDFDDPGYEVFRTEGWNGATITLTYVVRPEIEMSPNRFVYHADNSSQFSVSWEEQESGEWKPRDTYICTRSPWKEN